MRIPAPHRSTLALVALSPALALALAACGGGETAADTGATSTTSAAPSGGPGSGSGMQPGTSGEIAAVSGHTLQVQGASAQVAVSWTAQTTFTQQTSADLADVEVGSCVAVREETASTASAGSDSEPGAATSVSITPADDDGSCSLGLGGGPGGAEGGGPSGMPSDRPSDMHSDMPSDRPTDMPSPGAGAGVPGGGMPGSLVVGTVTATSADGFTVAPSAPGDGPSSSSSSSSEKVEVAVDSDTTFTARESATGKDATVGRCLTAQGEADSTGSVTATSISLSDPVDGTCSSGFGGGGPAR
ncbi:DUF5666 domain-containing protein [Nocardioides acrostichi]|uniref:DUF5666 domain-containing protein n=1 Tax=Nocardioides acrostichi TaxID=2784339 RepID=A0A930V400_9ACTN|nr:DUF5666 domain-containing protein [Nocardioides acrostichi]MBF4162799.1 hypothetical protein [Nocardioides acrostichi]